MLIRALQAAAGNFGVAGYNIEDSLRFNDDDSAYLTRTPSVTGDRKTWTWSGWVKRGNLSGVRQGIFTKTNSGGSIYWGMEFETNDTINVYDSNVGGSTAVFSTTAVFRDISGWYHIVVAIDTTQATPTNRAKLYINGIEITSFTAVNYPPLNSDTMVNLAEQHSIGSWRPLTGLNFDFDGYLAEINFIDGQALTPDDFGQIDETTGEWSPKAYEGTHGTNGFYLPFNGNANDSSGNGNNWTENNLASTDYMVDTPTNNFAVLNTLVSGGGTISQANLAWTGSASIATFAHSGFGMSSGKWYCETTVAAIGFTIGFGIYSLSAIGTNNGTKSRGYLSTGEKYANGTTSAYGALFTTNDIIGMAVDIDAGTIEFFKNNISQGVAFLDIAADTWFVTVQGGSLSPSAYINFGQDSSFAGNKTRQGNTDANGKGDFYYTPPTGFLALCTDNLPAPAIEQPETQFNVVTYTGDGASSRSITGVGFQPDFVWIKVRNATTSHNVYDVNRGINKALFTNLTSAESDRTSAGGGLVSFDADGFSTGADIGTSTGLNNSGNNYVAWCWKAGGTAVTNTDGSITSQVSANVDAGFSVVSFTDPNNASNYTVGHGLSAAPSMIIHKERGTSGNWIVWHSSATTNVNQYLELNDTAAVGTLTNVWGAAVPTSSVFGLKSGTSISGGDTVVAYCFHSVEGFSKFGSYVGNGSADGPFVYTGFKPAFVLYKRAVGGTGNWILADNEREGYNWDNPALYPNLTLAESSGSSIDILSNGFKVNNAVAGADHNASGSTYIYMAFAEHPFNYATGR